MKLLHIIKIGGNIIDDPVALGAFLKAFSAIEGHKILVHGGGKLATDLGRTLGIPQTMVDGRRITDTETLKIIVMVYAGLVNKTIVAQLQANGCNAIGLSGADGNLLSATKRNHQLIDFGWVGDVLPDNVNTELLNHLIGAGLVPVIAPVTHDGKGQLLNTNADSIASIIASVLAEAYAVSLTYCFEKDGVLRNVQEEDSIIPVLTKEQYQKLKMEGIISKGMIPKLDNAFDALDKGIEMVTICHANNLQVNSPNGKGTQLIKS